MTDYTTLHAGFADIFADIAKGAVQRELDRDLPYGLIRRLGDAGFGALRVPATLGGKGAGLVDTFRLLIDLGAADINFPQIWRAHFGTIEQLLAEPESDFTHHWLGLIAKGAIFASALNDSPQAEKADIEPVAGGYRVTAVKHYSTGSLYADWIVIGLNIDDRPRLAFVPTSDANIERADDWTGFGQRLTGSGKTLLNGVFVPAENIFDRRLGAPNFLAPLYQLFLLATAAGNGRAMVAEAASYVRSRKRGFANAAAAIPSQDPLVQQVIGRLAATAFSAEASVLHAVALLEAVDRTAPEDQTNLPLLAAENAASMAQITVLPQLMAAATDLFEVGGASAVMVSAGLDRHWRNIRTVSSHNPIIYRSRGVGDYVLNGMGAQSGVIFRQ